MPRLLAVLADFDSFYRPVGANRFEPSHHVQGAWQPTEQHMAPVSGLLTHCLEMHRPRPGLALGRITFEILGMIPAEVSTVEVEVIRPGRTIELVQAQLLVAGRSVVRATGWRLARGDTAAVAGTAEESAGHGSGADEPAGTAGTDGTAGTAGAAMPDPDVCEPWDGTSTWPGGYIRSVEIRRVPGARPGRSRAWLRTSVGLVEGVETSDLAAFAGLVDTANGIGARLDPRRWMFPNLDLSLHLFRTPVFTGPDRRWVGFDVAVDIGADGVGLTSSRLFDPSGPVGRAEQILTVRPLPG